MNGFPAVLKWPEHFDHATEADDRRAGNHVEYDLHFLFVGHLSNQQSLLITRLSNKSSDMSNFIALSWIESIVSASVSVF